MAGVSVDERRAILTELSRRGNVDLQKVWAQAAAAGDFRRYILDAFPELAGQYGEIAGQLAASWYEASDPASRFVAQAAPAFPDAALASSAERALNVGNASTGLDLLNGTLQRSTWTQARSTTELNAQVEGVGYARHASASACSFCLMLASRGAVYHTQASAGRGRGFHDHCSCTVIEVRAGQSYTPPKWLEGIPDDPKKAPTAPTNHFYQLSIADLEHQKRELLKIRDTDYKTRQLARIEARLIELRAT